MKLHEALQHTTARFPHKDAVVHHDKRLSFAQLNKASDEFARDLLSRGLQPGDRVPLMRENSAEYLVEFFGILKAGGVVVPMNTHLTQRERDEIVADCKTGDTSLRTCPHEFLHDLAMIIYTSGTTGKPKGVMLSHTNLMANARSIIQYLQLTDSDKTMVILPFSYSFGNSILTTHILTGSTMVLDNRFVFPNVVLDTMEQEQVTGFSGVPSHFAILLRRSALKSYKLPTLRYVTQAGGGLAPSMIEEFTQIVPHAQFFVMYGQTEASARLTYLDPSQLKKRPGSIGKAIPGVQLELITESGAQAQPGEIGEIVAKGDNIMLGYWNSPEETASVLRDNSLWTGDLAKQDEEGFFYLVSRKKDMIKSGANRISPLEIEDVVCQLPGVLECAAVAVADEILGEAIKLCVVKNGVPLQAQDILVHCSQHLAPYKLPKTIEFVTALPKTTSGKIKREALK